MDIEESIGLHAEGEQPAHKATEQPKKEPETAKVTFTKEEEASILKAVGNTITNEPAKVEIDIKAKNKFHAWLQKKNWMAKKRLLVIHPICIGTMVRISKLLFAVNFDFDAEKNKIKQSFQVTAENAATILEAVAIGILNKKHIPARELTQMKSLLEEGVNAGELLTLLAIIVAQMDVSSFMRCTVLIGSLHVLKLSTTETGPEMKMS